MQQSLKQAFVTQVSNSLSITWYSAFRSHHPVVFYKKCVLKYFAKFTGKHFQQSLFLDKLQAYIPAKCKLCKMFQKPTLQDTCEPFLLNIAILYEVGKIHLTLLENASEDLGKLVKILKTTSKRTQKAYRTKIRLH